MKLKTMWFLIAAYFFLFWFAVGNLGTAMACTFFLILFAMRITLATVKARSSVNQTHPVSDPPGVANWDFPPQGR